MQITGAMKHKIAGILLGCLLIFAVGGTVFAAEQPTKTTQTSSQQETPAPSVVYHARIQNTGLQKEVADGALAGTTGKNLNLEAFWVSLKNTIDGSVSYSAYVQNAGWQQERSAGSMAGTKGKALRIEAIKIHLTGSIANRYDIAYRVYVQRIGWLAWAKNGAPAGTNGRNLRIEAMQIKLVPKGETPTDDPVKTKSVFDKAYLTHFLNAQTHVQKIGWQAERKEGTTIGTTGRSLRLEGIKIKLADASGLEYAGGITYRTHVQKIGWQDWRSEGALAGTTGKSLRLEAIQIKLTGELANHYDVYYRAHVQHYGWLDWAKNGASAGTGGLSYRMEALQIRVVPKGSTPGDTYLAFVNKNRRLRTVALARTQLGYEEGKNKQGKHNNYTKYGVWYSRNVAHSNIYRYGAWCAMFVSWVGNQTGLPHKTWYYHAYCPAGVAAYQRKGRWRWKTNYSPKPGDLIYYDWVSKKTGRGNRVVDHVGLVESNQNGKISTIEGNYKDKVKRRVLSPKAADVFGYATPNY